MEPAVIGERLLGKAPLQPKLADSFAQEHL